MPRNAKPVNRRRFLCLAGAAGVSAVALESTRGATDAPAPKQALMKVGCQRAPTSDETLQYFAQFGVKNICGYLPTPQANQPWQVADLEKLKKRVESFGIALDMMALPLSSAYIAKAENPNIMLGKSPERDREIDKICENIRAAGKAGIPLSSTT
jgi:mannonate dehydratase